MASGSVVSRATGFLRAAVVLAALGTGLLADGYNVANTVPNILFILLVGGALNTVLVPDLVAAAQRDADGGAAHTDRLLTALTTALLALTAAATVSAPWIVDAYTGYDGAQRSVTVALAFLCLPQILFYGLFTVVGQVLNARGRFGPMAWAPVLSNLVVIAVFGTYMAAGRADGARDLTDGQILLLGGGTTAGIAVQALVLLPCLRGAGVRWRPRFDWRGARLGAPLRMAGWTVLMVLTDQLGYWVVTRLSTQAGQDAAAAGLDHGVGYTAYSNAYLLWIVPHGVITVSLMTAAMPRMSAAAADGDMPRLREQLSAALRGSAVFTVPAAFGFLALAPQLAALAFGHGRTGAQDVRAIAWTLMAFAPGLICYSAHYVLSRAFYALHDSRTPFLLNLVVFAVNAPGAAACYLWLPTRWAVTGMAGCFGLSFGVSLVVTAAVLRRRTGGLDGRRVLRAHALLVLASAAAAGLSYVLAGVCERAVGGGLPGALTGLAAGAVPLAAVAVLARARKG
ncbi:murein biosynthesis integral membrane protein MurJ [Streptomyces gamaensis]|uniref:Murein biosynthesis integral membrane protein MurJ n=1 Tax=Streptomyces gamaensis TaxID=1763542 RepID=A0ABW0Z7D9_9ACTN